MVDFFIRYTTSMKRMLYIVAFGFLGLLVAALLHGMVELIALKIIFGNPANADSFWWLQWQLVHSVVGRVLWLLGSIIGLWLGYAWFDQYGSIPGAFWWGTRKSM